MNALILATVLCMALCASAAVVSPYAHGPLVAPHYVAAAHHGAVVPGVAYGSHINHALAYNYGYGPYAAKYAAPGLLSPLAVRHGVAPYLAAPHAYGYGYKGYY